ncbi:hypothetical protein GGR42_001110 [Saonia flava]|uniref:Uncharacterized protein n=1 Tax=Saonia flava TaxID=523696 RepID=A0A846QRC2_9FLAO|nr:hypothetical protein [Saonia flava]
MTINFKAHLKYVTFYKKVYEFFNLLLILTTHIRYFSIKYLISLLISIIFAQIF